MAPSRILAAHAQSTYPSRPIHLVVPFPAGGATDILSRVIGQKLWEQVKQPVVLDPRCRRQGRTSPSCAPR